MPIKKIEGSASFEEIEEAVSKESPKEPPRRKKSLLPVILALGVIVAALIAVDWITSDSGQASLGYGSVSGSVVNAQMTPVAAEIFVLQMEVDTTASADGLFTLGGIPAGEQILIIAWQGMGKEIPVTIVAGQNLSIGQIVVEETKIPPEARP